MKAKKDEPMNEENEKKILSNVWYCGKDSLCYKFMTHYNSITML